MIQFNTQQLKSIRDLMQNSLFNFFFFALYEK